MNFNRLITITVLISSPSSWGSNETHQPNPHHCENRSVKLTHYDVEKNQYQGLTKEGIEVLKQVRDDVRKAHTIFESGFRQMSSYLHIGMIARLYKTHIALYGPGGNAKSGFIDWLLSMEEVAPFKILVNQTTPERAFIGGEDFEEAKKGKYVVNPVGSMADKPTAAVDEADQASPAVFSTLFKLLEQNPEIWAGDTVKKAKLETALFSFNATLPELQQSFFEQGSGPKFQPLMNRFLFKGMIVNQLPDEDRRFLHDRADKKRELEALAKDHPEVLKNQIFEKPPILDYEIMRRLGMAMFKFDSIGDIAAQNFFKEYDKITKKHIQDSERAKKDNPMDDVPVYFPAADMTTRLELQIKPIMIYSAFIDFLLSPMADDGNLKSITQEKIKLGPLSLWRSAYMLTTVIPGKAQLKLAHENNEKKVDIDFGLKLDPSRGRDARENSMILSSNREQERFEELYKKVIAALQSAIQLRISHRPGTSEAAIDTDFKDIIDAMGDLKEDQLIDDSFEGRLISYKKR